MPETLPLAAYLFLTGLALGLMGFFAAAVAPTAFRVLGEDTARPYIRAIFPIYYLILAGLTGLATIPGVLLSPAVGLVTLVVAIGFLFARQVIVPRANALRDEAIRTGSTVAEENFQRVHGWSVRLNMLQLLVLLILFWAVALR